MYIEKNNFHIFIFLFLHCLTWVNSSIRKFHDTSKWLALRIIGVTNLILALTSAAVFVSWSVYFVRFASFVEMKLSASS
jgi:apolipoprotein N-acyltransferase